MEADLNCAGLPADWITSQPSFYTDVVPVGRQNGTVKTRL